MNFRHDAFVIALSHGDSGIVLTRFLSIADPLCIYASSIFATSSMDCRARHQPEQAPPILVVIRSPTSLWRLRT
jgi:hypothetical protein